MSVKTIEVTGWLAPFHNPSFNTSDPAWAGLVCQNQTFLEHPTPVWEWTPVLDPHNDFGGRVVGVSGTALLPQVSAKDNPFFHPFDFDFEFFIAPDSDYESLLAPNNCLRTPDNKPNNNQNEEYRNASNLANDPNGLNLQVPGVLGLETDQGLVPAQYRPQHGDRVAVFGRWIADCGHNDFHTEIHPPLLLACARSTSQQVTHSTVVGRPYLVSQEFVDGGLHQHLINEIVKVALPGVPIPIPGSTRVEAHPQIKNTPFSDIQIMSYLVRPPSPRQHSGDVLRVQYHFTVRSGVVLQLVNDPTEDAVKVVIEMTDNTYKPAPLPPRHDWDITLRDLDTLKPGLGTTIKEVLVPAALSGVLGSGDLVKSALVFTILSRGIRTDRYDAPHARSVHDAEVTTVTANKLGAGPHFSVDDRQPFPVYGFLDVQWAAP